MKSGRLRLPKEKITDMNNMEVRENATVYNSYVTLDVMLVPFFQQHFTFRFLVAYDVLKNLCN